MKKLHPSEWQVIKETDPFFFEGAKVVQHWLENSLLTEEEYDLGITSFSTLPIGAPSK